ncbi:MAG: hypothetical protein ACSLFQ_19510 [Thermoanaerobaculia bacterium]
MKSWLTTLLVLALSAEVSAQDSQTELVLIPLLVARAAGAYGSLWISEIRIHNSSEEDISFGEQACTLGFCSFYEVPAKTTAEPLVPVQEFPRLYPGTYLYFARAELDSLTFSARVFDESRTDGNWGVTLPTVRWSEVRPQVLRFPAVTASPKFRLTLRLYSLSARAREVTVRYFNDERVGEAALAEQRVTLRAQYINETYAEIPVVSPPAATGVERIRIEVVADDPGLAVWGMLSITNNETQSVSIQTAPN